MVQFLPVSGYRFDLSQVGALSEVTCPGPSHIHEEDQDDLYQRHPCNAIRLVLNREEPGDVSYADRCLRADDFYQLWKKERILLPEHEAAAYFYQQSYQLDGCTYTSLSVIGRLKLTEDDQNQFTTIVPVCEHNTKERLQLLKTCRCQFVPLQAMLMSDSLSGTDEVLSGFLPALHTVTPFELLDEQGVNHRIWAATDRNLINELQQKLTAFRAVVVGEPEQLVAAQRLQSEQHESIVHDSTGDNHESKSDYVLTCLTEMSVTGTATQERSARNSAVAILKLSADHSETLHDLQTRLGHAFQIELVGNESDASKDACELAALNDRPAVAVGVASGEWSIVCLPQTTDIRATDLRATDLRATDLRATDPVANQRWNLVAQIARALGTNGVPSGSESAFSVEDLSRQAKYELSISTNSHVNAEAGSVVVIVPPVTRDEMNVTALAVVENQQVNPIVGLRIKPAPLSGLVFYSLEH